MTEYALIAAIVGFVLDGVSTRYAMRAGLVEVGRLSRKLFGKHMSFWEAVVWHAVKIAVAVVIYLWVPPYYATWILFGLATPTLFYAVQNFRRAKNAKDH